MLKDMIDLRSDTVTLPTQAMREAMYQAELGDSMRGEDPTMNKLEEVAAEKVGKEAAIFVSSGTMGNLVCLMAHTQYGDEVIFETDHHSYYYELGGFAAIRGLSPRLVQGQYGVMAAEAIQAAIRAPSPYFPPTRVLVIENTHNRGGGNAITLDQMSAMTSVGRQYGLSIHLDGARVFNAAIALGVDAKEITSYADSVQFCLSKGLSAPIGSIVAGSRDFISNARKHRKILGGDLRQSGVLAAAGNVALESMITRLAEDHQNAAILAEFIKDIPRMMLVEPPIPTNMVFFDTQKLGMNANEFIGQLKDHKVLAVGYGDTLVRMVTHRHITPHLVEKAAEAVRKIATTA